MAKIHTKTDEMTEDNEGQSLKRTVTTYRIPQEPPYVKLYLDTILYLKDLPKAHNPVLMAILKMMPWANQNQSMAINAGLKRLIAKDLGCSTSRIDHALTDFVKGEILYRLDVGLYALNPHIFGRGDWKDIEELRLNVNFSAEGKTIMGEIKRRSPNSSVPRTEKITPMMDSSTETVATAL